MFSKEAQMAAPTCRWMESQGLLVKQEFVTPCGICDLVGLAFNPDNVKHRLSLKQTKAIGSSMRTHLLLQIPEEESGKSITMRRLVKSEGSDYLRADIIETEVERLITDRFVVRSARGVLKKRNGWMPLQRRLVAIELKLARVEEALRQAQNHLMFTDESYAGFPKNIAERIAAKPERWATFFHSGVGLLSVSPAGCEVLIKPKANEKWLQVSEQMYCVEKFWRTHSKAIQH